jgi:hypothetical protein
MLSVIIVWVLWYWGAANNIHTNSIARLLEIVHIEGACMSWLIWVTV